MRDDVGKNGGFTLMEVLIAVSILVLMTVILYADFRAFYKGKIAYSTVTERYHAGRIALQKIRSDISMAFLSKHQAVPSDRNQPITDPNQASMERKTVTFFKGDEDKLEFTYMGHMRMIRNVKESDQGKVLYFIGYGSDSSSKALFRQEEAYIDDKEEVKEGQKLVLAEGVKSLKFSYWDIKKSAMEGDTEVSAGDWVKEWDSLSGDYMGRLPTIVKIELVLEGADDKEYKFETAVQLHVTEPLEF